MAPRRQDAVGRPVGRDVAHRRKMDEPDDAEGDSEQRVEMRRGLAFLRPEAGLFGSKHRDGAVELRGQGLVPSLTVERNRLLGRRDGRLAVPDLRSVDRFGGLKEIPAVLPDALPDDRLEVPSGRVDLPLQIARVGGPEFSTLVQRVEKMRSVPVGEPGDHPLERLVAVRVTKCPQPPHPVRTPRRIHEPMNNAVASRGAPTGWRDRERDPHVLLRPRRAGEHPPSLMEREHADIPVRDETQPGRMSPERIVGDLDPLGDGANPRRKHHRKWSNGRLLGIGGLRIARFANDGRRGDADEMNDEKRRRQGLGVRHGGAKV